MSVFLLWLSGCQKPAEGVKNAVKDVEIEFWTLQLSAFEKPLRTLFDQFEQQHPNVHVHWVDIPFSEGAKRTLTAVMSGDPPDVINLNPDFASLLATRNTLINMNQVMEAQEKETYLPVAWEAASLFSVPAPLRKGLLESQERTAVTFGLPWYLTSSVTLFNRKLLNDVGVEEPARYMDDLPVFIEKLHQKDNQFAMMPQIAEGGGFLKLLKTLDIPVYDLKTGHAVFASPKAVSLLEQYTSWYQKGLLPSEMLTEGHRSAVGRYQAGTLATINIGSNFLQLIKENAPSVYENTDVTSQFPANGSTRDFSLMIVVVPRKSKHPEEALAFAKFITNPESQRFFADAAPVLPSSLKALEQIEKKLATSQPVEKVDKALQISATQLLAAKHAYPLVPDQHAVHEYVDYYVQLALLQKLQPSNALKQAENKVNILLGK